MNNEERNNYIKHDKTKRIEIINNSLMIGLKNKNNLKLCKNVKETQQYFQENYKEYLGNILTQEKYKASDFWFNDAGFQFKWRNFENNIILECLSWNEVYKLIQVY